MYLLKSNAVQAQPIVISFDNPNISPTTCSTTFIEDGISQQIIPNAGNCSFSYATSNNGELWLFPASLTLDLSGLGSIDKIEIDQYDFCGPACSSATLNNNGAAVVSTSNTSSNVPEMLVINNPSQLACDELIISSYESLFYEIRIFVAQNVCANIPAPTISGLPSFTFTPFAFSLSATPAGGTFSGPGIIGNSFYPTLAGLGTHFINYTYTDANGCTATTSKRVIVVRLRPFTLNPFKYSNNNNEIALEIEAAETDEFTIELFDLNGRNLHRQTSKFDRGIHHTKIQLTENLTEGLYIISISNSKEQITKKVKL